jgi:hypothetical protein
MSLVAKVTVFAAYSALNPLVPNRTKTNDRLCISLENSVLKILQFCFLGVVRSCIGLNFSKSEV